MARWAHSASTGAASGVQLAVNAANYQTIATSAQQFLDAVLANLNGASAATWAPQFDSVRLDPTASNLRWFTLEDGVAVLKFALARVHYPADSNATAHPFAVFFRLCNAMVSGFTFDPKMS